MTKKSWTIGAFLVLTAFTSNANAYKCKDGLRGVNGQYVDLDDTSMSDDLREAVQEARDEVKKNLGFLPVIRRTNLLIPSDIKLFEKGVETRKENAIAALSFTVNGTKIEVSRYDVKKKYRKNGLSELLLAEVLAANPEVDEISISQLQDTNLKVFDKAVDSMSLKEAIRETPVYKICKSLGFSKIVKAENRKSTFTKMWIDGKKYFMVDDYGGVYFTVARPKN